MGYLDTHARTASTTKNDKFQPTGRVSTLFGVFMGYVKDASDVQKNGRLRVWIPELGSTPENENAWLIVNYCSPFAGSTNTETISTSNIQSFEGTQTSYGMWMVPPDINNQVMVMFINGDISRGIWIGSLYNQYMNNMVPGSPADARNHQYPGKQVPVAEYNKWDSSVTRPDRAYHPYQKTKFKGIGNQGLINDKFRGVNTSGARRESPSQVFGILTPGPALNDNSSPDNIRRAGGSSFTMDDGVGSEYTELSTKSGAKIKIDETNGFVYIINRDGTTWIEMDADGNVDVFGAKDISMRAGRDVNFRADRNVNIEAGQNIFMKAAKDTTETTTSFTYDVNNIPVTKSVPYWEYKGEGNGDGGNIVTHAVKNWQSTSGAGAYITVEEDDLNIAVGNSFSLTTENGTQDYASKLGIKVTTEASLDLCAGVELRAGSVDKMSLAGSNVLVCGETSIELSGKTIGTEIHATALGGMHSIEKPNKPIKAGSAQAAEVKPLNTKINILPTWSDPNSKFKRNSEELSTTSSRLPTFEPCPEHASFSLVSTSGYTPSLNDTDRTYQGSAGVGNVPSAPVNNLPPATETGFNNTQVLPDTTSSDAFTLDLDVEALKNQLIFHEGRVNRVYNDNGYLSAGIGHLLRSNELPSYPLNTPVSDTQIDTWFTNDSATCIKIAQKLCGDVWANLSDVRKRAVCDLAYNLGQPKLSKFVKFFKALKQQDYGTASIELKDSIWYGQVGRRGRNITTMIGQNIDPIRKA